MPTTKGHKKTGSAVTLPARPQRPTRTRLVTVLVVFPFDTCVVAIMRLPECRAKEARPWRGGGKKGDKKKESMHESKRMEKPRKTDIDSTYRIKRLERTCLILSISVLLLAVFSIRLVGTVSEIAGTFEFLTEQLDFIGQKVDAIRQGIQSIQ